MRNSKIIEEIPKPENVFETVLKLRGTPKDTNGKSLVIHSSKPLDETTIKNVISAFNSNGIQSAEKVVLDKCKESKISLISAITD